MKLRIKKLTAKPISYGTRRNSEIYDQEISDAHRSCAIHLHDLSMLTGYCVLDPAKISGVNFEWNAFERPYVKKEVQEQPVVGGFFGQGKIPNVEMLLRLNPELILVNASSRNTKKMSEVFGSIKKPMLYLSAVQLEDYLDGFEILGEVTGKQERAAQLINYARESLNLTAQIEEYIKKNNLQKVKSAARSDLVIIVNFVQILTL